jgi:uncharacterized protein YbjT (DUF2867 family)
MHLVVFGASGGTGWALVTSAATAGMPVRAFVRDRAALPDRSPAVEVVEGDVRDAEDVDKAVTGADAVVCLLGLRGGPAGDTTVSTGTRNIVAAMERFEVSRLVCQTCFGLGESMAQARWVFRRLVHPFLRGQYADRESQERIVAGSGLDWTIVRPTHLVDRPAGGRIQVLTGKARLYDAVARADVAAQLLAILPDPATHRRALTLASA